MNGQQLSIDRKSRVSPSTQIEKFFRGQIHQHEYLPGDQLPTTSELVESLKVSPQTVRQALSRLEEEGLVESTPGRGTFVKDKGCVQQQFQPSNNFPAKLKNIAVAGAFDPQEKGGWFRRLTVGGVIWQCHQFGSMFSILPNEVVSWDSDKILKYLRDMQIDGLVWVIPEQDSWRKIEELEKSDFPVVVVRLAHGNDNICSVEVDHQAVGFDAAKHFIDRGCNKIAFFTYERSDLDPVVALNHGYYPSDILFGIDKAFKHYNGSVDGVIEEYALGDYTNSSEKIERFLASHGPEYGLFFVDAMQLLNFLDIYGRDAIKLLSDRQVVVITNHDNYNMFVPYIKDVQMYTYMEDAGRLGVIAVQKLSGLVSGNLLNTCTQIRPEVTLEGFSTTKLASQALQGLDYHQAKYVPHLYQAAINNNSRVRPLIFFKIRVNDRFNICFQSDMAS